MISYKPLFRLLLEKNMSKTQLREAIGFSTATLAKLSKGEYVSMEILDKICTYMQCNIADVIEYVKESGLWTIKYGGNWLWVYVTSIYIAKNANVL